MAESQQSPVSSEWLVFPTNHPTRYASGVQCYVVLHRLTSLGEIRQVEFSFPIVWTPSDTAADIAYSVATPGTIGFSLHLKTPKSGSRTVAIQFGDVHTSRNAAGSIITRDLSDGNGVDITPFILSGNASTFVANETPVDWLHSLLPYVGCLPLQRLCLTGSHDAGMSKAIDNGPFTTNGEVITQAYNIGIQLQLGVRFFDLRPVVRNGVFETEHREKVAGLWEGADGQDFASIVNQINDFLSTHHELVVLDLSQDTAREDEVKDLKVSQLSIDLPIYDDADKSFTAQDWARLATQLSGIKYLINGPVNVDLTQYTLNDFIRKGPAVIVLLPGNLNIDGFMGKGFFDKSVSFPVYNKYSDTNDENTMAKDQLTKMREYSHTGSPSTPILLSWTLTQKWTDYIVAGLGSFSIEGLAKKAKDKLYAKRIDSNTPGLWDSMNAVTYPNVIHIDGWDNQNPTALAIAINRHFAPQCS